MLTTAGLIRSTTSAKLTDEAARTAVAGRATYRPVAGWRGAPAVIADRETPPATMAPTRNATKAVSATVTTVNRRDIYVFIISC
jgi:hypothetical protein